MLPSAAGAGIGGAAGRSGSLWDLLAPLDYPRQSLWNLPASLGKGDIMGALPGLLGGAAGLGLAATGAGLPLALLGGSLVGGLGQGIGRSTGSESFDAPTPGHLVEALGMDPESLGGMATGFGLGIAGDPLTWAGGFGGRRAGQMAGEARDLSNWKGLSAGPLDELFTQGEKLGIPTSEMSGAAHHGAMARRQQLGMQVGHLGQELDLPPIPPPGNLSGHPADELALFNHLFPEGRAAAGAVPGRMSLQDTQGTEGILWDLLQERPHGFEKPAAGLVDELSKRGSVPKPMREMPFVEDIGATRKWNASRAMADAESLGLPARGGHDLTPLADQLHVLRDTMTGNTAEDILRQMESTGLQPNMAAPLGSHLQGTGQEAKASLLQALEQAMPENFMTHSKQPLGQFLHSHISDATEGQQGLIDLLYSIEPSHGRVGIPSARTMGETLPSLQQLGMDRLAIPGVPGRDVGRMGLNEIEALAQKVPLQQLSPEMQRAIEARIGNVPEHLQQRGLGPVQAEELQQLLARQQALRERLAGTLQQQHGRQAGLGPVRPYQEPSTELLAHRQQFSGPYQDNMAEELVRKFGLNPNEDGPSRLLRVMEGLTPVGRQNAAEEAGMSFDAILRILQGAL